MSFKDYIKVKLNESNSYNEINQIVNRENVITIIKHLEDVIRLQDSNDVNDNKKRLFMLNEIKSYMQLIKNNLPILQLMAHKTIEESVDMLKEGTGLSLMGSGNSLDINGEINIAQKDRRMYANTVKEVYFSSLAQLVEYVLNALKPLGLVPKVGIDEEWIGGMTGALSDGEDARLKMELVKDNKDVKNSMLILNIYKDNSNAKPYELNTYLS